MAIASVPLIVNSEVWVAVFSNPAQPRMASVIRGTIVADPGSDQLTVRASVPARGGTVEVQRTVPLAHVAPVATDEQTARRQLALSARPTVRDCTAQEDLEDGVYARCPEHSFWTAPSPARRHSTAPSVVPTVAAESASGATATSAEVHSAAREDVLAAVCVSRHDAAPRGPSTRAGTAEIARLTLPAITFQCR
jgi:hypothetical protein